MSEAALRDGATLGAWVRTAVPAAGRMAVGRRNSPHHTNCASRIGAHRGPMPPCPA